METSLIVRNPTQFKSEYCRCISGGMSESVALAHLKVEWLDYFELMAKDESFRKDIDNARKARAEVWVGRIMDDVKPVYETDDLGERVEVVTPASQVPGKKLRFEQLKFLAKADNPERYGEGGGRGPSVEINLNDFKLLPPAEAVKALNNDPFNKMVTIDAEVMEKPNEND